MTVRRIEPGDVETVVAMVHELAAYERSADECHLTPAQLRAALFAESPALFGHVALQAGDTDDTGDGDDIAGFALWFLNYSTWDGVHGIYLEDLYVRPVYRGGGHGRALLAELATECMHRGYTRLQWWVLDWNEPSIDFYRGLGAEAMDRWTVFRLSGAALNRLGGAR